MLTLATLCLLANPVVTIVPPAAVVAAPQGASQEAPYGNAWGYHGNPPGGGTPEPTMLLLLAGGALTYGGCRLRARNGGDAPR